MLGTPFWTSGGIRWLFSLVSTLACASGGTLWAISPLGIQLSEQKFKTPEVFWKLFPSVPLLLAVGLIGLHLWQEGRAGVLQRMGFYCALAGLALILAGDVSMFFFGLDDVYIMTAPAYRAFRAGLLVLAVGSLMLGTAALRSRTLPVLAVAPFVAGALCGLAAFARDLGGVGVALWIAFGVGWAWLGLGLLMKIVLPPSEGLSPYRRTRRRENLSRE